MRSHRFEPVLFAFLDSFGFCFCFLFSIPLPSSEVPVNSIIDSMASFHFRSTVHVRFVTQFVTYLYFFLFSLVGTISDLTCYFVFCLKIEKSARSDQVLLRWLTSFCISFHALFLQSARTVSLFCLQCWRSCLSNLACSPDAHYYSAGFLFFFSYK